MRESTLIDVLFSVPIVLALVFLLWALWNFIKAEGDG